MRIWLRYGFACTAFLGLAATAGPAAASFEQIDTAYCIGGSLVHDPATALSGSFTCPGGASAKALSDLGTGTLGALAKTSATGHGMAETEATFGGNVTFLPNQVVSITATLHFTGAITGGQASGPTGTSFVFEASVNNGFLNFGIRGTDDATDVRTTANGQSGVGSFANATLTEVDTSLARDHVDITISETSMVHTGASGIVPMNSFLYAQAVPAVVGDAATVDFLDPGSFSFSVPPGTVVLASDFAAAAVPPPTSTVPEPGSIWLLAGALSGLRLGRRWKQDGTAERRAA